MTWIGVFICHCGSNIAGTVDVEEVANWVTELPDVAVPHHVMYTCSDTGQEQISNDIWKQRLDRIM